MFWRFIVHLCLGSSIILMDSLNLKIRALQLLETTCIKKRHRIPEYSNLRQCHSENVGFNKPGMLSVSFIMLYVTKLIRFIWHYKAFSLPIESVKHSVGSLSISEELAFFVVKVTEMGSGGCCSSWAEEVHWLCENTARILACYNCGKWKRGRSCRKLVGSSPPFCKVIHFLVAVIPATPWTPVSHPNDRGSLFLRNIGRNLLSSSV